MVQTCRSPLFASRPSTFLAQVVQELRTPQVLKRIHPHNQLCNFRRFKLREHPEDLLCFEELRGMCISQQRTDFPPDQIPSCTVPYSTTLLSSSLLFDSPRSARPSYQARNMIASADNRGVPLLVNRPPWCTHVSAACPGGPF